MFGNRRGPFGRGFERGFGFGGFGPRFERGDMKFVILEVIKAQPRHGYDIIQELGKKFNGMYTPSSGTVYPTLQLLEDQDLITSDQKTGKKIYSITDQGLQFLKEHQEELDAMKSRLRGPWGENSDLAHAAREDFGQIMRLVFTSAHDGKLDADKRAKLLAALKDFRGQVEKILSENQPATL